MPFVNLNKKIDASNSNPKILVWFIVILFFLVLPSVGVFVFAKKMSSSAKGVSESFKQENFDDLRSNVSAMKSSSDGLNFSLNFLIWMRIVPFAGGYYADAKHFAVALGYELDAAGKLLEKLEPYKTELGFDGHPSGSPDRVAQFVKMLDKSLPQIGSVEPQLKKAHDEVRSIDVNKYPDSFRSYHPKGLVESAKNFIMGSYIAVKDHKDALQIAPQALGEPLPKNYLIIFQNDKEIRATGGFMSAYAFMGIDKGKVTSSTSDDIYRLDEKLLNVCKSKICPLTPPGPIVRYLPEANGKPRTAWSMRDSNISPDVPTSAKQFERMYSLLGEGTPFDGIVLIDTHVVEELIKVTGPVDVYGTKYSAEFDKRCNCPNVIFELENYAQIIERGEQDRKAILGVLMQQILAKSLGTSVDKMPEFVNALVKLANGKHILFYMHEEKVQNALSRLNWTGEVKNTDGDFLMVNDSNFAGGKSNLYVEQKVVYEVDTRNKKAKLTIDYKNPQPFGIWLNGINRDYVRVYAPKGSNLTSSKGSEVTVTTIEDLGKTVFEAFVQVRPQNSRQFVLEYDLPQDFSKDGKYPLLIQKQPGTKDFEYIMKINGNQKASFKLSGDMDLKL